MRQNAKGSRSDQKARSPHPGPSRQAEEARQPGVRGVLLELQRLAGNSAVSQMIQRSALGVSPADSPAEMEAERSGAAFAESLAGRRATKPAGGAAVAQPLGTQVSRKSSSSGETGGVAGPRVASRIAEARSGGSALPGEVRLPLESHLGTSLDSVRIHTDNRADSLNHSLHAEAFTTGRDVFFRAGAYQPHSPAGAHLLAHEMTHVVQQGGVPGGTIHRSLVRDQVYSDAEFTLGMPPARQGGTEETAWQNLVAQLKDLEKKHVKLDRSQKKLDSNDPFEQRFSGRESNLDASIGAEQEVVDGIPTIVQVAEALIANERAKKSGLKGTVKNLFKGKTAKAGKASRLDRIETLLTQLRRRREQLSEQMKAHRLDLANLKMQKVSSELEGPEQKKAAMEQARTGAFGVGKGTVNDAKFGAGAMGSVAQVDYKDDNGEVFKGVFKAEPEKMPDVDGGMTAMGTNESSPNFSLRAVAASRLNDLLGMKVIPKTDLAFHEQFGFGQVMALASGRSPQTTTKVEIEDANEEKIAKIEQVLRQEAQKTGQMSKLIKKETQTGEVKHFLEEIVTYETDWDSPILKRELANLQLMDGLIGNVDRHAENYFIQVDAFGNPIGVLGIDNDLTFARDKNDPTEVAFNQGHHAGMPPAIDSHVAEKFCAVTEEQVRATVKGLLTGVEVESLIVRLKSIQKELGAKAPSGDYAIPRFASDLQGAQKWTDMADPKKTKGAYFARERNWQQGGMKSLGRLLKPQQALLYQEERLAEVMKKVQALGTDAKAPKDGPVEEKQ